MDKNKIKKLKLYGKKGDFKGFIAEIYVKDNKIVVESKDKKLKKELLKRINEVLKKEKGFWLPAPDSPPDVVYEQKLYIIDDPWFLNAMCEHFTHRGKLGCLVNGYLIISPLGSKVVSL